MPYSITLLLPFLNFTSLKSLIKKHCQVYTVSDESTHLLISNIPAINLSGELCGLCNRFGSLVICSHVPSYENQEKFVETYHVQYSRIQCARYAKKQLDGRSFYGAVLHVCYAPELESVDETRSKLVQRRKEVAVRIKKKQLANAVSTVSASKMCVPEKTLSKQYCHTEEKYAKKITTLLVNPNNDHLQNKVVDSGAVSGNDLMESSNCHKLKADSKHLTNSVQISSAVSCSEYSKTNKLSFLPRPLVVRKQIVFH